MAWDCRGARAANPGPELAGSRARAWGLVAAAASAGKACRRKGGSRPAALAACRPCRQPDRPEPAAFRVMATPARPSTPL